MMASLTLAAPFVRSAPIPRFALAYHGGRWPDGKNHQKKISIAKKPRVVNARGQKKEPTLTNRFPANLGFLTCRSSASAGRCFFFLTSTTPPCIQCSSLQKSFGRLNSDGMMLIQYSWKAALAYLRTNHQRDYHALIAFLLFQHIFHQSQFQNNACLDYAQQHMLFQNP